MMSGRLINTAGLAMVLVALAGCDFWTSTDERIARAATQLDETNYRSAMTDLNTVLEKEPGNARARGLLADLLLRRGDAPAADKELQRALATKPDDRALLDLQYEVLRAQGRYDDMAAALAKDESLTPTRRLVVGAIVSAGQGNPQQAEEQLAEALRLTPDDPQALLERAALTSVRDSGAALELTQAIKSAGREQALAMLLRSSLLMARGQPAEARDALQELRQANYKFLRVPEQMSLHIAMTEANLALGDLDNAAKSLAPMANAAPESLATHYFRARIALMKGDGANAVAESQRALRVAPDHVPSQLLLAAAHLARGSTEQAEGLLTKVLASHPENVAASKLLAQVYLSRQQPDRAAGVLNAATGDPQVDWLLGAALLQSGSADGIAHLERSVAATPDDIARRLDLAGAYISAGTPDKALPLLQSVPAQSPLARRARALQLLASVSGKPPEEAGREVDRLIAANSDDVGVLSAAATWLTVKGADARARELLERIMAREPNSTEARMLLAMLDVRARDTTNATRRLTEILKIDPKHKVARQGLSEIAWLRGDRAEARRWLEEAVSADPAAVGARLRLAQIAFIEGDLPRGRDLLNQAISVAPDRKSALDGAGQVLARAGLTDEALKRFSEARTAGLPEATLHEARLLVDLGRLGDARALLQAATSQRPKWQVAEQMLIEIDARSGQVDQALARMQTLTADAAPAIRHERQGDVYALARRFDSAIEAYEAAQRAQPRSSVAIKLFQVRRTAKLPRPEEVLTRWLARAPGDNAVRQVLAGFYESSGSRNAAIAQYERLLADGRDDPISLNNLAWLLHQQGDPKAVDLARRAHELAPGAPEIADTFGWILVQTGSIQQGLEMLKRAEAGGGQNGEIAYHLAVAHAKSGQKELAAKVLTKLLASTQDFPSRAEAERLLASLGTQI
jgi:putative PEP-CTERM system TPR-repeat lipoprotein